MATISKTDLRRAEVPSKWVIRPGGNNGMKLTYFQPTTKDAVDEGKVLSFTDKSKSSVYGGVPSQGVEVIIDGYVIDPKTNILYVVGDNQKIYRLLVGNSLKADTNEGVIQRLLTKNVEQYNFK